MRLSSSFWLAKFGACAKVPWPWIMPSSVTCVCVLSPPLFLSFFLSLSVCISTHASDQPHTYKAITDSVSFFFCLFGLARVFLKTSCILLGNCRQLLCFSSLFLSLSFFSIFPLLFHLLLCWHFVLAAADAARYFSLLSLYLFFFSFLLYFFEVSLYLFSF